MDQVLADLATRPVIRVFPNLACLTEWMDAVQDRCDATGVELELALDTTHCAVILFVAGARPDATTLHGLAKDAAQQFHERYGPGGCAIRATPA